MCPERDGVQYYVTGGGGAHGLGPGYSGNFHHYLKVRVIGRKHHVVLIKENDPKPYPPDFVVKSQVDSAEKFASKILSISTRYTAAIPKFLNKRTSGIYPLKGSIPVSLTLNNIYPRPIRVVMGLENAEGWTADMESPVLEIPATGSITKTFHLQVPKSPVSKMPRVTLQIRDRGESFDHKLSLIKVDRFARARPFDEAPQLNGKLDDGAWHNAPEFSDFTFPVAQVIRDGLKKKGMRPARQTRFRIVQCASGIYFSLWCEEDKVGSLKTLQPPGSSLIHTDDAVEVYFGPNAHRYRKVTVNAAGNIYTSFRGFENTFKCKAGTAVNPGAWTAEIFFPRESFDSPPEKGEAWLLNVGRLRPGTGGRQKENTTWCGDFNRAKFFGRVVF